MSPRGWVLSNLTGILLRNLDTHRHQGVSARGKAHVRTQGRWSSARQGEKKPQEKPNLMTVSSWISSLQTEKVSLCCLSPSLCDILLCQPLKRMHMVIQGLTLPPQVVLPGPWTFGSSSCGWQMGRDTMENCAWKVSMLQAWRWYTLAPTFYWLPNCKGGWEISSRLDTLCALEKEEMGQWTSSLYYSQKGLGYVLAWAGLQISQPRSVFYLWLSCEPTHLLIVWADLSQSPCSFCWKHPDCCCDISSPLLLPAGQSWFYWGWRGRGKGTGAAFTWSETQKLEFKVKWSWAFLSQWRWAGGQNVVS